ADNRNMISTTSGYHAPHRIRSRIPNCYDRAWYRRRWQLRDQYLKRGSISQTAIHESVAGSAPGPKAPAVRTTTNQRDTSTAIDGNSGSTITLRATACRAINNHVLGTNYMQSVSDTGLSCCRTNVYESGGASGDLNCRSVAFHRKAANHKSA